MSGALLQLVARGHEDTHLMVDVGDAETTNFFRQVYRKHVPFSIQTIELGAPVLDKVFGESLKFTIPRKGDLLCRITLAITMKRDTSVEGATYFPAEEFIENASLIAGLQTIDQVTGEWIRIHRELFDKTDERGAYKRLVDFSSDESPIKTLWLNLPFFIESTPFPMIAAQFHNLELSLSFKNTVRGIDMTYEPKVKVYADFAFLDNSERALLSQQKHALLIEQLHIQDERVAMQETEYHTTFDTFSLAMGAYKNIIGDGTASEVILFDRLHLAQPPLWQGLTSVQYDLNTNAGHVRVRTRFKVPQTGTFGISWLDTLPGNGYNVKFETVGNDLTVYVYRGQKVISIFRKNSAWSDYRTSIKGPGVPLTLQAAWAKDEAWINVNIDHDIQRRLDGIRLSFDIEGYTTNAYWAGISPEFKESHTISVIEGIEPIDTNDVITSLSVYGDSTTSDVIATDFSGMITSINNTTIENNYTFLKTQLYFRHPVKYIAWVTSPQNEFGKFATGPLGNDSDVHDPLHSATLFFNNHERYPMLPALYYNAVVPSQYNGTSPSTGIHMMSFCKDPPARAIPTGSANFSRMASVVLSQQYKRVNTVAIEDTTRLVSEDEMLADGVSFDRLRIYAVCWNILRIEGGLCGLAYAS